MKIHHTPKHVFEGNIVNLTKQKVVRGNPSFAFSVISATYVLKIVSLNFMMKIFLPGKMVFILKPDPKFLIIMVHYKEPVTVFVQFVVEFIIL